MHHQVVNTPKKTIDATGKRKHKARLAIKGQMPFSIKKTGSTSFVTSRLQSHGMLDQKLILMLLATLVVTINAQEVEKSSGPNPMFGLFMSIAAFFILFKLDFYRDFRRPPPARERRNNIAAIPHQIAAVPFYPAQEDKSFKTKSSETSTNKNQFRYTALEKKIKELETKENMDIACVQELISALKTTLKIIENYFIDNIDFIVMDDPRTLATGITYDSRTLKEWFKTKSTCPYSNQTVSTTLPAQNKIAKNMIEDQLARAETIIKQIEHILEEKNKAVEARVITLSR